MHALLVVAWCASDNTADQNLETTLQLHAWTSHTLLLEEEILPTIWQRILIPLNNCAEKSTLRKKRAHLVFSSIHQDSIHVMKETNPTSFVIFLAEMTGLSIRHIGMLLQKTSSFPILLSKGCKWFLFHTLRKYNAHTCARFISLAELYDIVNII